MLLINHATIRLVIPTGVVAAVDLSAGAGSLQSHYCSAAKSSCILSGLIQIELFNEWTKQHQAGASLLEPTNVLVYIVTHNGLELCLPPAE
jgi:hypothetical protein